MRRGSWRSSTKVSKNQVVCARCHLTGLASGIDWIAQSSAESGAASARVASRTAAKRCRERCVAAAACGLRGAGSFIGTSSAASSRMPHSTATPGVASDDLAHHRRRVESFASERSPGPRRTASGAHATSRPPLVCGSVSMARSASPSRGAQLHAAAVARPVPTRGAGDNSLAREIERAGSRGMRLPIERARAAFEPLAISSRWPSRPKPVTSVSAWTPVQLAELRARRVELRGRWRSSRCSRRRRAALLQRRADDADAERLAEYQLVAGRAPALRLRFRGSTRPIATRP